MRLSIPFATLLFASLIVSPAQAQFGDFNSRLGIQRGSNIVSGTLYGPDGSPLGGAEVEVRDFTTMDLLATVYSRGDGSFEVGNLPGGALEVIAVSQGFEARQVVNTSSVLSQVELRMNQPRRGSSRKGGAVSLAQLKVPQKARDRYVQARDAFARGKIDRAEQLVAESLSICPKNAQALTLRGVMEVRKQNPAAAMQDFQAAIEVDPNYGPAYTSLSDLYNTQGNFDDAQRATERAIAVAPNAWQGYFEMSRAYIGKGMYDKALELAKRAQSMGADVIPTIHLLKASAMVPLKLYKDASQELQAFLAHPLPGQNTDSVRNLLAQVQAAEAASATAAAGMSFAPAH